MSSRSRNRVGTRAPIGLAIAVFLVTAALATAALQEAAGGGAVTVTGTVSTVKATERTVTIKLADGGEAQYVWSPDTRITGVLSPGARVTIRYVADGNQNRALQITVSRS
jgi:hypothetical protein